MHLKLFYRKRTQQSWKTQLNSPILSSPAVGKLKGTSEPYIVIGTKGGSLVCLDHAGTALWKYLASEHLSEKESYFVDEERVHAFDSTPILEDVQRDGKLEILATTTLGTLYCISHDGKKIWSYDTNGTVESSCTVADVNGDGLPEILVGSGKRLLVLTSKGKLLFEYDVEKQVTGQPHVLKTQNTTLIIFGTQDGELHAITPSQKEVWKLQLKGKITCKAVPFDTREEMRVLIGTHGGSMYCISEHGEIVWEYKTEGALYHSPIIADINEDGEDEAVFGSCDNSVYALSLQGAKVWNYSTDFWIVPQPVVADFNRDGKLEVVAASYDHNLYLLEGEGRYVMDYVPGLSSILPQSGNYSSLMTSDPGEQAGSRLASIDAGEMLTGCALLETINGNEVVFVTKEGTVGGIIFT